jgi:dipeptidase E
VHGYGFLEYNKDVITEFMSGLDTPLLFVPYAADKKEWDAYTNRVSAFFSQLGISVKGIHSVAKESIQEYKAVFVGGGNTFRLLHTMQEQQLMPVLRDAVVSGRMRYMGSSAGTNLACKTIRTTNDMPIIYPKDGFEALNLLPCQVNAHYFDADPDSKHKGETREQRLAEFHQINDTPVIGLREGAYLLADTDFEKTNKVLIGGKPGARIFVKGKQPYEATVGKDIVIG